MDIGHLTFRIADPGFGVCFYYLMRRDGGLWLARSEKLLEMDQLDEQQFALLNPAHEQYILGEVSKIMSPRVRLDLTGLDYSGPSYCLVATSRNRVSKVRECFSGTETGKLCAALHQFLQSCSQRRQPAAV